MKPALLLLLLVATVLRFWELGSLGISHWDAGSYVAGPQLIGAYGKDVILPFYAPGMVPFLHGLLLDLFGGALAPVFALHAALGTLTVLVLFLCGRRLVGNVAALLGAAMLAGMEFHVIYSRQPLTDVAFTLLFLCATWALWAAWQQQRLHLWALGGLLVGATFFTKYHGFFPLLLLGGVLAVRHVRALRGGSETAPGRHAWTGLALAAGISALPAAAILWSIHSEIGFEAFRANRAQWLTDLGPTVLAQTARSLTAGLVRWVSPEVLAAAGVGGVILVVRRRAGDQIVLGWLLLFGLTLPIYQNYPRLTLPLLPPLALAAGVGLEALLRRWRTPLDRTGPQLLVVLALLTTGTLGTRDALLIEDRGYAEAAAQLENATGGEHPDLLVTQHAILPYLADATHPFLTYDEADALEHLRAGHYRHLVFDLRSLRAPEFLEHLARHRDELQLVAVVDNPIPEPFIANLIGFDRLGQLQAGLLDPEREQEISTIRIYRR